MSMKFTKYHALGNDYIVLDPRDQDQPGMLAEEKIKIICNRHFGIGSDGILFGPLPSAKASFALQIYNPDGSEAAISGNGLRIFCRYLWDNRLISENLFSLETKGGIVQAQILDGGKNVRVGMGHISFNSADIPVVGPVREVLQEEICVNDKSFVFCAATIGNPHCIIILDELSPEIAKLYGPVLENHPYFPRRANVQFVKVLDRNNIQVEIWERGAGYTLTSGSSSCAAAATAHKLNLCDSHIRVHMPGGVLDISIDDTYRIVMTGPVMHIANGYLSDEMFGDLIKYSA